MIFEFPLRTVLSDVPRTRKIVDAIEKLRNDSGKWPTLERLQKMAPGSSWELKAILDALEKLEGLQLLEHKIPFVFLMSIVQAAELEYAELVTNLTKDSQAAKLSMGACLEEYIKQIEWHEKENEMLKRQLVVYDARVAENKLEIERYMKEATELRNEVAHLEACQTRNEHILHKMEHKIGEQNRTIGEQDQKISVLREDLAAAPLFHTSIPKDTTLISIYEQVIDYKRDDLKKAEENAMEKMVLLAKSHKKRLNKKTRRINELLLAIKNLQLELSKRQTPSSG